MTIICQDCGAKTEAKNVAKRYCAACTSARQTNRSREYRRRQRTKMVADKSDKALTCPVPLYIRDSLSGKSLREIAAMAAAAQMTYGQFVASKRC